MNFKSLATYHDEMCETLFDTIVNDNNRRLCKFLPEKHEALCFKVELDPFSHNCMYLFKEYARAVTFMGNIYGKFFVMVITPYCSHLCTPPALERTLL